MNLKNQLSSFVIGLLFAIGLNISGMTQPQKVMAALDFFNQWDPSLFFVMAGAVAVHMSYFFLIKPRFASPRLASTYQVPTKTEITGSLILGSLIFGIGWGLGGFCPGPVITSLGGLSAHAGILFVGLILGMITYKKMESKIPLRK